MTAVEMRGLRPTNVSMGMMLENISPRLMEPGMPHHNCPDKEPGVRLATIEAAGEERVPFTSGILVGIGENNAEIVDSLIALEAIQRRHGHIQEVIVQNFRAKADTRMRALFRADSVMVRQSRGAGKMDTRSDDEPAGAAKSH